MRPFLAFISTITDFTHGASRILVPNVATYTIGKKGAGSLHIEHPIDDDGKWLMLVNQNIVYAPIYRRNQQGEIVEMPQPFRIYKVTKTRKNGRPTISADAMHVFYDLNYDIFPPNSNRVISDTYLSTWLQHLKDWVYYPTSYIEWRTSEQLVPDPEYWNPPINKFTFSTNQTRKMDIVVNGGTVVEHIVGNADSLVSRSNADFLCDGFTVHIDEHGTWTQENAFNIAYGLNMNGITQTIDDSNEISLLLPNHNIEGKEYPEGFRPYVYPGNKWASMGFPFSRLATVDFNYQIDDSSNIDAVWNKYLYTDAPGYFTKRSYPDVTYSVDLYAPQVSDEIKQIATYEVGDSGVISDPEMGITTVQTITKKTVDLLTQRVKSIELSNNSKEKFTNEWGSIISSGQTSLDKRVKSIL